MLALEHLIHAGYAEAERGAELRRLGYDPDRVLEGRPEAAPKVYAENARADAMAALRELLVREALGCGLASSETAFVAVRSEAGRVVEGRVAVATLGRLVVRFPDGTPDPRGVDPGLELRVFVDDPTTPRARVRLADLVRRRGERPLNLRVGPGRAVRIVLADPAGAWARGAPRIEVALGW